MYVPKLKSPSSQHSASVKAVLIHSTKQVSVDCGGRLQQVSAHEADVQFKE